MKRLLLCWLAVFLLFTVSCGNMDLSGDGRIPSEGSGLSEDVPAGAGQPVNLAALDIGSVVFRNLSEKQSVPYEYTRASFINEFRSFISNQVYSTAEGNWEEDYHALLLGQDNQTLLELSISGRSVAFDRDVDINGSLYKKGRIYETQLWLNEYMNHFLQGIVQNPAHVSPPAKVGIPGEYHGADMSNAGNGYISDYKTLAALHAFIGSSVAGRDFEIAGCERLYSYEAIQREEEKAAKARVIHMSSSSAYLHINSSNAYDELVKGHSFSLYKDGETAGLYRLVTGEEVLLIKVEDAFDRTFQELFDNDGRSGYKLGAADVKKLLEEKKPYFMEYLCSNLGIERWDTREDDAVEWSTVKLDNGYVSTVLSIKNPFNLRLLLFNKNTGAFTDSIDFGGRAAGTDYTVQRWGKDAWIVGSKCYGYGTGICIYNREWYTVDEHGKQLALSIPYYYVEVGPYGGSTFEAEAIQMAEGNPVRLKVSYDITRIYMLDIAEADEYGQVKVTSDKQVEFVWDGSLRKFVSELPVDQQGITQISYNSAEISGKCGTILEKQYDSLLSGIKALESMEDKAEKAYRANAYKLFLQDCPDGTKKTTLLALLPEEEVRQ